MGDTVAIIAARDERQRVVELTVGALTELDYTVVVPHFALDLSVRLDELIATALNEARRVVVLVTPTLCAATWPRRSLDRLMRSDQQAGVVSVFLSDPMTPSVASGDSEGAERLTAALRVALGAKY